MAGTELRRHLGLTSAIMITVGSVIGSGIFMKPLIVSQSLPDTTWVYGVWIALGLVCLCGALAYGELGAMLPEAGGQYAFLREGWGRMPAFLFGWCFFLVINTGTMSALGVVFTKFLGQLLGVSFAGFAKFAISAGMILVLAAVNHFGVKKGAALQNVSTFTKIGSLLLIVVAGYLLGSPEPAAATKAMPDRGGVAGVVAACVAIFWSYEGWHQLPFSAAELKRPGRNLPLGLILGVVILVALYLIVNAVYFHLVPIEEMRAMASQEEVPTAVMQRTFGNAGVGILAAMIAISVFGAANPNMLSGSRAFFAMAGDRLAPGAMTRVHSVWGTPVVAIWSQAIWAIVLLWVMESHFRNLTDFVVFVALVFYGLSVAAVYVLRVRRPDAERPHRCLGYPVTPAVFIAAVLFVDIYMLFDAENRANAIKGLVILVAGIPAFFVFDRLRKREEPSSGG